jgi:hypothetical protein
LLKSQISGVVLLPVILAVGRLRQEDCEFKISKDYIARPCLKRRKKKFPRV